jgi:hypothetical protein
LEGIHVDGSSEFVVIRPAGRAAEKCAPTCDCYTPNISKFSDMRTSVLFSGEGPRIRRYGRTAAMRLIVQPFDGDDDYYYFLSFS